MGVVQATLSTWKSAALQALKSTGASWPAMLGLLVGSSITAVVSFLVIPLGFAGGFISSLVNAAAAGSYLFLLETSVLHRRRVRLDDVTTSAGRYLWDVISVLFIFWIGSLLLSPFFKAIPALALAVNLVVFVVFNPAPELVYQGHSRSLALLGDAVRFVFDNWPEWFIPQVVVGLGLLFLYPGGVMPLLQATGPYFGFTSVAVPLVGSLTGGLSAFLLVQTVLSVMIIHMVMLFRGFLYRDLSRGNRRARAWKARLG